MNKNKEHGYNTTSFYTLNDYAKDVSFKYTKANFLVCTTRIYINTDKKEQYQDGQYRAQQIVVQFVFELFAVVHQ